MYYITDLFVSKNVKITNGFKFLHDKLMSLIKLFYWFSPSTLSKFSSYKDQYIAPRIPAVIFFYYYFSEKEDHVP
jgi:hypothetical protein